MDNNNEYTTDKDDAFLKLFKQYEKDVYRIAYVYLKNKSDALDIVQETAYKTYLKFETLEKESSLKSWIIKTAINSAIDLLRKNKKIISIETKNIKSIFVENDISLSISLQNLLTLINEDEKTVLLLKYYQGYTFKEISEFLDIPISTVKSGLYKSLKKMRKYSRRSDFYGF
ncbi:sigma-70 family RNA polymerase sigma factor [Peribacillus sp. FSL E2-0159]|uniref:RNA polymerase sigma factor n=1 Tax=Peribacillus sp. FSL E2-0159 TaxID=2975289 RepID=UPI00315A9267